MDDGKAENKLAKALDELRDIYAELADDNKYMLFESLDTLMRALSAENYLAYLKKRLIESDDMQEAQHELDTLHAAVEKYETMLASLKDSNAALIQANSILTTEQKRTMAQAVVLFQALTTGSSPSADEIAEQINQKAKRHLVSLKDSLADLLGSLPVAVARTKAAETAHDAPQDEGAARVVEARQVDDSAAVADAGPEHNVPVTAQPGIESVARLLSPRSSGC
jgi:hypothetical protein